MKKLTLDNLNRWPTHNSTLAIGGVPSPHDSFVVAESSVLRTNFCTEKPAHRQSAKRYGGTFAHKDIAFKFASWISVEFELYLIKEFQRLKEEEQKQFGWNAKRELAKINYHIHTEAVKQNLIPNELTPNQISKVYANEADVLNMALFGITAKEWRDLNPDKKGNMRDYAQINELICLSNLENINALLINENITQQNRLMKLNQIAIQQMLILENVENRKMLK